MSDNRGLISEVGVSAPPFSVGPYRMSEGVSFNKPHVGFKRFDLVENFAKKPGINADIVIDPDADDASALAAFVIANRDFEVLGTGATTDDVTFGTTVGGLLLTTDSSGAQQVIIAPHLDTDQTAWASVLWGTENQVIWEAVIRTGASIADVIFWGGLKLTNDQDIATDDDQCFFRFDAGSANWECVYSVGGVADNEIDSGVVVAINTNYYFRIEIDSDRKAHFFIDNLEVGVSTALTNDVDLIPYVGVEGNAKTMYLIKEAISRIIFE